MGQQSFDKLALHCKKLVLTFIINITRVAACVVTNIGGEEND
jgi:hypothetical protein